jgi:hypothetical protein
MQRKRGNIRITWHYVAIEKLFLRKRGIKQYFISECDCSRNHTERQNHATHYCIMQSQTCLAQGKFSTLSDHMYHLQKNVTKNKMGFYRSALLPISFLISKITE